MSKFVIPVKSFRKIEDPYGNPERAKYVGYVHLKDVPDNIPMATNPREQNLRLKVPKVIEESLLTDNGNFYLLNRGLVLSAAGVKYDNQTQVMTIVFDNPMLHGDIDGGHTYKIMLRNKASGVDQYVQFEIMTGVEDIIERLAAARNTSAQVDDKSIAELEGKFGPIKDAVGHMPFFDRIAFKQNQYSDEDFRTIDARDVVAVMSMFNIGRYNPTNHPTAAYSSKATVLKAYLQDQEPFKKMRDIAENIFDLYNLIERDFPDAYNSTGGKYGSKNYSLYKQDHTVAYLKFGTGEEPLRYKVPEGILYPFLGAFRALVEVDSKTGMYRWRKSPFDIYQKLRGQLAAKVVKFGEIVNNNPQSVGKESGAWDMLYLTVERHV